MPDTPRPTTNDPTPTADQPNPELLKVLRADEILAETPAPAVPEAQHQDDATPQATPSPNTPQSAD